MGFEFDSIEIFAEFNNSSFGGRLTNACLKTKKESMGQKKTEFILKNDSKNFL